MDSLTPVGFGCEIMTFFMDFLEFDSNTRIIRLLALVLRCSTRSLNLFSLCGVQATGEEIPLVIKSCIRVINLYGKLDTCLPGICMVS